MSGLNCLWSVLTVYGWARIMSAPVDRNLIIMTRAGDTLGCRQIILLIHTPKCISIISSLQTLPVFISTNWPLKKRITIIKCSLMENNQEAKSPLKMLDPISEPVKKKILFFDGFPNLIVWFRSRKWWSKDKVQSLDFHRSSDKKFTIWYSQRRPCWPGWCGGPWQRQKVLNLQIH